MQKIIAAFLIALSMPALAVSIHRSNDRATDRHHVAVAGLEITRNGVTDFGYRPAILAHDATLAGR